MEQLARDSRQILDTDRGVMGLLFKFYAGWNASSVMPS